MSVAVAQQIARAVAPAPTRGAARGAGAKRIVRARASGNEEVRPVEDVARARERERATRSIAMRTRGGNFIPFGYHGGARGRARGGARRAGGRWVDDVASVGGTSWIAPLAVERRFSGPSAEPRRRGMLICVMSESRRRRRTDGATRDARHRLTSPVARPSSSPPVSRRRSAWPLRARTPRMMWRLRACPTLDSWNTSTWVA